MIRQGLKNDERPKFQGIDEKHGDLKLAIEIDTNELIDSCAVEIQRVFEIAALRALIAAGAKYGCSMKRIEAELTALKA